MGLLSRLGDAARAARGPTGGMLDTMMANSVVGGAGGALMGGAYGNEAGDGVSGALGGAALGAGLGLVGGAPGVARALGRGFREGSGNQLEAAKLQAMEWIRNAPEAVKLRVIAAQTPEEVHQIVQSIVSSTRSIPMEGGF